jgi:hypothetical protein
VNIGSIIHQADAITEHALPVVNQRALKASGGNGRARAARVQNHRILAAMSSPRPFHFLQRLKQKPLVIDHLREQHKELGYLPPRDAVEDWP